MQLDGSFVVCAPRLRVWEAIRDPALMAACVPGCHTSNKAASCARNSSGMMSGRPAYTTSTTRLFVFKIARKKSSCKPGKRMLLRLRPSPDW